MEPRDAPSSYVYYGQRRQEETKDSLPPLTSAGEGDTKSDGPKWNKKDEGKAVLYVRFNESCAARERAFNED